jgi:hypothetical protein
MFIASRNWLTAQTLPMGTDIPCGNATHKINEFLLSLSEA